MPPLLASPEHPGDSITIRSLNDASNYAYDYALFDAYW